MLEMFVLLLIRLKQVWVVQHALIDAFDLMTSSGPNFLSNLVVTMFIKSSFG